MFTTSYFKECKDTASNIKPDEKQHSIHKGLNKLKIMEELYSCLNIWLPSCRKISVSCSTIFAIYLQDKKIDFFAASCICSYCNNNLCFYPRIGVVY